MRVCPDQVQFLPGFRETAKNRRFALGISSSKRSVGQVHADNFCLWRRNRAKQEQRAPVIRSDLQAAPGSKHLQKISQLQYFRAHLPHQNGAINTVINDLFERFRASAKGQFTVAFDVSRALQKQPRHDSQLTLRRASASSSENRSSKLSCCAGVIQAALNSILLSRSNSGSMPTSPASVPMRSFANCHRNRPMSLASAAVEISHVRAAYRSGRSLVASNKRPCNIPRKFMRIPSTDRPELPTRCQQIAVGTYTVFHLCTPARHQLSPSPYPRGSP